MLLAKEFVFETVRVGKEGVSCELTYDEEEKEETMRRGGMDANRCKGGKEAGGTTLLRGPRKTFEEARHPLPFFSSPAGTGLVSFTLWSTVI
jgi:hypothetical protein